MYLGAWMLLVSSGLIKMYPYHKLGSNYSVLPYKKKSWHMHTFIPSYSRVCTGHPQSLLKFVNYYLGLGHLSSHLLTFTSEFTRLSHSSIASHLTVNAFRVLQKKSFCIPMKNFFVTASQLQIWYLVLRLFSGCIAMRCTGIHFYIFFYKLGQISQNHQIICSHVHPLSWK